MSFGTRFAAWRSKRCVHCDSVHTGITVPCSKIGTLPLDQGTHWVTQWHGITCRKAKRGYQQCIEDHFNRSNSRGMRQGIKPGDNKCTTATTATTPPDSTLSDTLHFERRPHTPVPCSPLSPLESGTSPSDPEIEDCTTASSTLEKVLTVTIQGFW